MNEIVLTPEQQAEAERIEDILKAKAAVEIRFITRLLASKSDRELLGATEFRIRDAVHRLGASGIDAALSERKKGVPRVEFGLPALRGRRAVPGIPEVRDHHADGAGRL